MPPHERESADRLFRLDNESLAFRFTATLSFRGSGDPHERLTEPARLALWLRAAGLLTEASATEEELAGALALREAIHRAGTAVAAGGVPEPGDERLLTAAAGHRPAPLLVAGRAEWAEAAHPVAAAIGIVAADAVETIGGAARDRVRACEGAGCGGLFVDTSRGRNRRWCSMNTCGNRAKKSRR